MNGNGIFLSIQNPTWKRVDSIVEAVLIVDIRHRNDVEIIIVDNASEMEIYNALEEKLGKSKQLNFSETTVPLAWSATGIELWH